ncbi:RNA recognition motif domain-containing protein [Marinigracilibium pacificum]|uniref:RNA-binding protein n=1 Tax=Marinigracilibium pacificum TaxID=2729599 RepID=A0A848IX17_9BACT|nr:RNA-binding protein [Marinigracilibium pacificum]NMM47825.1 RNA-binding protein [Marinigracilibium pacificum]
MNIYVGNLDYQVNESDLKSIFQEFGSVNDVKIIQDRFNGRSKGFGFVTMNDSDEAEKAIAELDGSTLEDRKLVVNIAREKSDSNSRNNNSYNNRY